MNRYDRLVQEAALAKPEEMLDIYRSGWQKGIAWKGLDAFILEDIANACSTRVSDEERRASAFKVEDGLIRSTGFQQFSQKVASERTIINAGGVPNA